MTNGKYTNKEQLKTFNKQIGEKAQRKIIAMHKKNRSVWFGLGMFGMIGWSVTIPTLLGVAFGVWLDKRFPESFSWTLNGLIVGLFAGCFLAWHWVSKEHEDMNKKVKDDE